MQLALVFTFAIIGALATPVPTPPTGGDATASAPSSLTDIPENVTVTRQWALDGLGSDTAQLDCPAGYDVGSIFYKIESSNKDISALAGSTTDGHQTYGTAALTNWSLYHQTTTLSLECYLS